MKAERNNNNHNDILKNKHVQFNLKIYIYYVMKENLRNAI